MKTGDLKTPVTFERGTVTTDDAGGETLTWDPLAIVSAKVMYGTGQERRQAAQERTEQAATVMVRFTPTLASVTAKDRITFGGANWDIASPPAVIAINHELHFTVIRSA